MIIWSQAVYVVKSGSLFHEYGVAFERLTEAEKQKLETLDI